MRYVVNANEHLEMQKERKRENDGEKHNKIKTLTLALACRMEENPHENKFNLISARFGQA